MDIQTRHDILSRTTNSTGVRGRRRSAAGDPGATGDLNYRIHTGLFIEDISLKLRAHTYDLVAIYETFAGASRRGIHSTGDDPDAVQQRRNQFVV